MKTTLLLIAIAGILTLSGCTKQTELQTDIYEIKVIPNLVSGSYAGYAPEGSVFFDMRSSGSGYQIQIVTNGRVVHRQYCIEGQQDQIIREFQTIIKHMIEVKNNMHDTIITIP